MEGMPLEWDLEPERMSGEMLVEKLGLIQMR
jgi:hypothetical protein